MSLLERGCKATSSELAQYVDIEYQSSPFSRSYSTEVKLSSEINSKEKKEIFSLFKENMYGLVSKSSFGWTPSEKRTELFHPDSRFILMRARESVALDAFAMFRFDTEENVDEVKEEVLYLYELQVSSQARKIGLGKFLVSKVEVIGAKYGMTKLMLTSLISNKPANDFYKKIGFTIDPISPASSSTKSEEEAGVHQDLDNDEDWEEDDEADYEILSKALV